MFFIINYFLGVPLSSKTKGKSGRLYHKFTDSKGKLQVALLGQIRVFDSKRVERLLANVDTKEFTLIKHKVKENIICFLSLESMGAIIDTHALKLL